jgi:4-hydroxy-3-methylbut-2-en-1-yl diphosphate reductase
MNIIRAKSLGMCFGVRDAIALALGRAETAPLTILGDLVHNSTVLAALRSRGIAIAHDVAQVKTQTVMVTAHGASERALAGTRALGVEIVEATCPLVHVAHRAVASLVRDGYHPVIIGQRDHVEVRGLTDDLDDFDVVLDEADVLELDGHPRIGIAAQTTQSIERVQRLVALIRRRFPRSDVRFIDTVCHPTKQRQNAAVELARQCDVVIVVGGANSNNTRELVDTCRRYCPNVHHVQTGSDLRREWFSAANEVGITAGTSTPDHVIDGIHQRIEEFAAAQDEGAPSAVRRGR